MHRIELTSRDLTWDPSSSVYEDQENKMLNYKGEIIRPNTTARGPLMSINSICVSTNVDTADISSNENLANVLASQVDVTYNECVSQSNTNVCSVSEFSTGDIKSQRKKLIDGDTLAKRWRIDRRKARNTVRATTQRGVRTCLHPSLSRRYPTNDRFMRYGRLPHSVFSDTMIAGVTSKSGNKNTQVYCTQYGWSRFHPIKLKSDAHESLSLLFSRDGVPPRIAVDNSKEQTLGRFAKNFAQVQQKARNAEKAASVPPPKHKTYDDIEKEIEELVADPTDTRLRKKPQFPAGAFLKRERLDSEGRKSLRYQGMPIRV